MDKIVLSAPTDFIYDKRLDGWKLLADVPLEGNQTLELAEFLRDGKPYVNGEVMLSRAMELGNMAGQCHAERVLGLAGKIPESWRVFVLVFPGTVWQSTHGYRHVSRASAGTAAGGTWAGAGLIATGSGTIVSSVSASPPKFCEAKLRRTSSCTLGP